MNEDKHEWQSAGAQQAEWREEVSFAIFKNLKQVPWFWKKNVLIVFIYGLNSSFKMLFYEYLVEKNSDICTSRPFFQVL